MQKKRYNSRRKSTRGKKEKDLVPRVQDRRKKAMVELGYGGTAQRGRDIAEQCMGKCSESTAKERNKNREVRRTFKMLREVLLNIGVKELNMHEGITIKVLLDSSITSMFMNRKIVAKHGFRLQKLERPIVVRNVNGTNNSMEAIIYQVEVNIYYENYIERMRMDICDLGKTDMILGMPWLQAHNPEINWKTKEVKMTRYLHYVEEVTRKRKRKRKEKRIATLEEKKIVRQAMDDKKNQEKEKEVKADHRKIEEMVPKKFLKQRKVFRKVKSEKILTGKVWDHTIDLKEMFQP